MGRNTEKWLPAAFAAAVVIAISSGAVVSCGDDAPEPYGSSTGAVRQYETIVDDCRIQKDGAEYCCYEQTRPVSMECPGGQDLQDQDSPAEAKSVCAPREADLVITWEEVDQLGVPYQACGDDVTEHRFCRCGRR